MREEEVSAEIADRRDSDGNSLRKCQDSGEKHTCR